MFLHVRLSNPLTGDCGRQGGRRFALHRELENGLQLRVERDVFFGFEHSLGQAEVPRMGNLFGQRGVIDVVVRVGDCIWVFLDGRVLLHDRNRDRDDEADDSDDDEHFKEAEANLARDVELDVFHSVVRVAISGCWNAHQNLSLRKHCFGFVCDLC